MVYVLDVNGRPLMPTKRHGKVRHLLKNEQAKIINYRPFTIQLMYKSTTYTQQLYGGTDAGRKNIGNAVVLLKDNEILTVYTDHVTTRNKDVTKCMKERAEHRRASRRGERKRRQRRAKKNNQSFGTKERLIPGCDKPIKLKHIINTESRFNNRKRSDNWITPTVRHLVQTHLNHIDELCKIMPITYWTLELNKFSFMKMEDGKIYGVDYQNGRLKGFDSVNDYIHNEQNGKCIFCNSPIDHYHHVVERSKGGSDGPENIVGLCAHHHDLVHKDKDWHDKLSGLGQKKKYADLSVLNQAIPFIYQGLVERFGEDKVFIINGWETKELRDELGHGKDHWLDSIVIASSNPYEKGKTISTDIKVYEIQQYKNHDRALIKAQTERKYYLDGKCVATNRHKRTGQTQNSLHEFYIDTKSKHGKKDAHEIMQRLTVKKRIRRYNDTKRLMPGAVFMYNNGRYVMSGQLTNGQYLRAVGQGNINFPRKKCRIISNGGGLVYL